MTITVNKPFLKRSPLRELAQYFYQDRLTREDYVRHRSHLIDHLCGLAPQLDPVVAMLVRASENNTLSASDITEPQGRTVPQEPAAQRHVVRAGAVDEEASSVTRIMGVRPAVQPAVAVESREVGRSAEQQSSLLMVAIGILGIALLATVIIWVM